MIKAHIISLFPEVCKPYFTKSIVGKAVEKGILEVQYYNPIDEVTEPKRLDDRPYGGGPGMVLRAEPFLRCFKKTKEHPGTRKHLFLTPGGTIFTQEKAKEYAEYENLVLFCGHYEGIDERVAEAVDAEHVSTGSYTVTGGELPAMLIIDAVLRQLPGVLGNEISDEEKRMAGRKVYTRPQTIAFEGKEYTVPEVLLSGHHKKIDEHRSEKEIDTEKK